jgi:four helix bundle protein
MKYETNLRNKNRGYLKLIVWQNAMDLFERVWRIAYVESNIDFKLRSQLVDAAQSVSANIAERYGRRSSNEYIQFLYIALGSLAETFTRAIGLQRTSALTTEHLEELDRTHYEVENRLLRLIEKLEQKRDTGEWTSRIAEDDEDANALLFLQHSSTPTLHHSPVSHA